jgi:osmoprotectant transport system substrate-binding protein
MIAATGASITGSLAGCLNVASDFTGGNQTTVTIGGKQFTEQLILSNVSTLLLRDAGFTVEATFPVGGSTANYEGIISGRVDHYWEYTGTAWNNHLGREETVRDPQEFYENVSNTFKEEFGIVWLQMADFNNTYVVTANEEWKQETGVKSLSGLAEYINSGNEVRWAVSQEYLDNPSAFGALPEFYDFKKNVDNVEWVKMAIGTINYQAVANGNVDLGVGFATNSNIEKFGLPTIEDDQNWFVIYYPAPLVQEDVLTDEIRSVLNEAASALDTKIIQSLNLKVANGVEEPKAVAQNWLREEGLL